VRGDGVEHGLRFGVREVEVGGLGDFSFGVGDEADRRTAGVRLPHAGSGGRDDGDLPGEFLLSSSIWARAALTSSALVFACPPRAYLPSGAPVSSTQVRSVRAGSLAAAG
jgi:hypothetical protein